MKTLNDTYKITVMEKKTREYRKMYFVAKDMGDAYRKFKGMDKDEEYEMIGIHKFKEEVNE